MSVTKIPPRNEAKKEDTWNLTSLYPNDGAWEKAFETFKAGIPTLSLHKGKLAENLSTFRDCLNTYFSHEELGERLGYYSFLRYNEDASNSDHQARQGRFMQAAVQAESEISFLRSEVQSIPDAIMQSYMEDPSIEPFKVYLKKLLRYKPHILSPQEERVIAMAGEANQTAQKTFGALTDVDMDFGVIQTPEEEKTLSQSSYGSLIQHKDRKVREQTFVQFHNHFESHKNTLASLYAGSIQLDVYQAKVRNYSSSVEAALFPDNVPVEVYRNLVNTVRENLPTLHSYYKLRSEKLGVKPLELWDTKVSLVGSVEVNTPYDQAVSTIIEALQPLGDEYCSILKKGLTSGWVDKYENKGKRSGAFSAGSFHGDPYILMNYKDDVLRDVFTLAHEAGHSMHSWYSTKHNPFPHYQYTIFEAEVASTFNEQLLFEYMMAKAESKELKAYLLNKQIDDMLATLYRQTMFAEFELKVHEMSEHGQPLTVDAFRDEYRSLMEAYFGPDVAIHESADMEGLRIPHFYRAFYVYKYATGISAAVSLSQRVLQGGTKERDEYFSFLKSGGSTFPIDSLKKAGVDMSKKEPIVKALKQFEQYVSQLGQLLD